LGQLARLESEGVRIWGIQTFKTNLSAAEDSLKKANALFDRQLYSHSLKHFQAAIYTFDQLRSSQGKRFEIAMENGLKAFEALDTKAAISQFKIAAALKPGDGNVTKSLDRARKLPTVLSNISQGKELESSNKLIKARDHYQAAVTLDAAYAPAKESLLRIKNKINERDYKQSISNAYSLFDRNNLKEASKELRRARKIRPNAPEIQDLAKKITSARQTANLTELQKQARAFEEQEKW
jgi:tetratricopeptide (TPR) repeat protein